MSELGCQVIPPYMIATKEAVKERADPVWTKRKNLPNVTESYHTYMTNVSLMEWAGLELFLPNEEDLEISYHAENAYLMCS